MIRLSPIWSDRGLSLQEKQAKLDSHLTCCANALCQPSFGLSQETPILCQTGKYVLNVYLNLPLMWTWITRGFRKNSRENNQSISTTFLWLITAGKTNSTFRDQIESDWTSNHNALSWTLGGSQVTKLGHPQHAKALISLYISSTARIFWGRNWNVQTHKLLNSFP